jgi:hypothetical protein
LPLSTTMRSVPPSPQEHKSAHHKRAQHTNTMSKSEAPWQARVKATPRCKQMTMANSQVKGGPGSLKGYRFQVASCGLPTACAMWGPTEAARRVAATKVFHYAVWGLTVHAVLSSHATATALARAGLKLVVLVVEVM